jgi:hypothetical protein
MGSICMNGCSAFNFGDNLVGKSFQQRMCLSSYDVVYTWVNGSDPRLKESKLSASESMCSFFSSRYQALSCFI